MFKKFRLFAGILGLFVVLVAASTSDTNPDWSAHALFLMAGAGIVLFCWGVWPYTDMVQTW
jgi:ureidoglycolate hydrolase